MITIRQDAECMTNLLPAIPVPAETHFVAFKDENSSPAILSLTRTGQLSLIVEQDGVPVLLDFSKNFGIADPVTAFDARQGADLNLSIAIAVDTGDGKSSSLHLICDIAPDQLSDLNLQSDAIHSTTNLTFVHDVFISDFTREVAKRKFPLVFVAFQPIDKITKEEQLGFVNITQASDGDKFTLALDTAWKLATNPQKIIAVAFGTCRVGQGAFVLYETAKGTKLQFRTFHGKNFQVEPICPDGATCLISFVHPKTGYSILIVGGKTVTSFTSQQYVSATSAGTTIIAASKTPPLRGIHASTVGSSVTIWYTTSADSAYSYEADVNSLSNGTSVPILAEGRGGRMSGLITIKSSEDSSDNVLVKTVLSVDQTGNLTLTQQAADTRMWRTRPFYAASASQNLEISGYTMRLQAVSDDADERITIPGSQLHVVCSGYLRAIVNGRIATFSRDGDWYDTDQNGVLTIISESTDIASSIIHVDEFRGNLLSPDASQPVLSVGTVDPTGKMLDKLRELTTPEKLLDAKMQTGEYLVDRGAVTQDDAEQAVKAIALFLEQVDNKTLAQTHALKAGIHALRQHFISEIVDNLWDAFNWVEEKATAAAVWVVDRISDGISLTVYIAGEVYTFVANTLETAKKGISWVLSKIGVGIEKLINFAGFIFNWSDILHTSDNFVAYFNAGLDYGEDLVASFTIDVKAWIEQLRATVKECPPLDRLEESKEIMNDLETKDESLGILSGVSFNWSSYQMSHGSAFASAATDGPTEPEDSVLLDLWQLLVKQFNIISTLVENLSEHLTKIFTSDKWTLKEVMSSIAEDVVDAILSSIENILDAFLKAVARVIRLFKQLANAKMEFPVFTALWKHISSGRPFTLLNLFSLILAVPSTILYKLVMGKAPPVLGGRLNKDTLSKYVHGSDIPGDPDLRDDMDRFAPAGIVVVQYVSLELWLINTVVGYFKGPTRTMRVVISPSSSMQPAGGGGGPMSMVQYLLDGSILDLLEMALRFPMLHQEGMDGLRWLIWGIDTGGRLLKIFKFALKKVNPKLIDKVSVVWTCGSTAAGFVIRFIIIWHEYFENSNPKDKIAPLRAAYKVLDEFLKAGGEGAKAVATFAKTPKVVATAAAVRCITVLSRITFTLAMWIVEWKQPKPVTWQPGQG